MAKRMIYEGSDMHLIGNTGEHLAGHGRIASAILAGLAPQHRGRVASTLLADFTPQFGGRIAPNAGTIHPAFTARVATVLPIAGFPGISVPIGRRLCS